jgi:2-succinyl-6-hydroxy-2,4-cyclohexadiene-1-carboxylate synthase
MGGRIALFTAINHPDRIKAVVLESCSPGLVEPQARRERAELDDRRAETILSTGLGNFVDSWYDMAFFQTIKSQPELFRRTIASRKANDAAWVARIISELSPGRQPAVWPHLGNLSAPALLLAGALDLKYANLTQLMAEQIPGSKVEIVPNAGHNIHLERPDRFVQVITNFLQRSPLWLTHP